ncbi:hypothetical protein [Pyrobaculum aerophilum]|uniref:Uncharacterized protein n=1 Tax=Pyrobaculum aerophilum TaxID=13773 RepID=A0A371QY18_9CREN|nr:hypothetical protein [Pyrobaculum aerophilum]RFA95564.1 hypothetical protein CGL52_12715 [Pyrobaculum aerophilum]RFA98278.1 hypothetical protein CGL51_00935 [Pyrobaculum aerophilum]
MTGVDALPALGVEPGICGDALKVAEERLAGTGLETYVAKLSEMDLGKLSETAVELVVKSLVDGVNYVSMFYIAVLRAVRDVCPREFGNAAALLAVLGFDALWMALGRVVEMSGMDPQLLKTLFEISKSAQPSK